MVCDQARIGRGFEKHLIKGIIFVVYSNINRAVFIDRPNRFIARIKTENGLLLCHVKNTGRCRELLTPGAGIWVQKADNPLRKTAYDLIAVYKEDRLFNIDSTAPNHVFAEWVRDGSLFPDLVDLRPESRYGESRFDYSIKTRSRQVFVEIKGVTLEENGIARFPDAPTMRGEKHMRELADCVSEGYGAMVVFILQFRGAAYLEPNWKTDPALCAALKQAHKAGVDMLALECNVGENRIEISGPVELRI